MAYSDGQSAFKNAFEISPIALSGGVASGIPGGVLSIFSLLSSSGVLGDFDGSLDDTFANFFPLAGGELISNQYGNYPFANMTVAANAVIRQPISISMLMRIPVRTPGGYNTKSSVMTALKNTLDQHIQSGGTFSVATPTFFYSNVLLTKLHDVSGGETQQAQYAYQWDFWKPLVTLEDAQGAQNAMMSLLSSGAATDGSLSGVGTTIGQPITTASGVVSPAATGSVGVSTGAGSGIGVYGLGGDGGSLPGSSGSGGIGMQ
jgi:hypothetical protein